jgi:O-antigen ligase
MSALIARIPFDRHRVADGLWLSAHTILGVMPVVMAIGHRSSTLVIALASAAALAAMAAEGRLREWLAEATGALRTPLGLSVLAFLAFGIMSIAWSVAPGESLRAYAQFASTLGAAFILAFALPRRMPRAGPLLLAISVAIACLLIMLDLWTDLTIRQGLGFRAGSFIFNRPVLTLLVLTIPLVWLLARRGHRGVSAILVVLVAATILQSDSGAAVLGSLAGLTAYVLARASRFGASLLAYGLVAAVMLAPLTGAVADRILPPAAHESLAGANTWARVEIWKTFGEAVRRDPLVGGGFGVSPRFPETRVAQEIAPHDPSRFAVWHPHNAALQIWVELGAVGAVLGILVIMLLLSKIGTFPRELASVSLALVAAVAAVSLVGHGAWQGWWTAAVGAAIVWLRYDARRVLDERL